EPNPPIPKAKPKNNPEIIPILPGISSCAYTSIAENADEIITPIITDNAPVQNRLAYGNKNVNGAAPNIDIQIIYFRPYLSPKLPPSTVPTATAAKNMNKC